MDDLLRLLPVLVFVALMGFLVWQGRRHAETQKRLMDEAWSEVARCTRLNYDPGRGGNSLGGIKYASRKPGMSGDYRGRHVSMNVFIENVSMYDSYVPIAYTSVRLQVANGSNYSLTVQEKGMLAKKFEEKRKASDGVAGIDPRFSIKSRKSELATRAASLVGPLILQRSTMEVNRSPFFWTSATKYPIIQLKGSDLVWQQYDVLIDAKELTSLLNQLCDLAELVEAMQSETVVPESKRSRTWRDFIPEILDRVIGLVKTKKVI